MGKRNLIKQISAKIFIVALVFLSIEFNYAQAPAGYYDSATGTGFTLKTQLYNIIKGHTVRSYDQLWTDFQSTDKKANGTVWDMYSDKPGSTPSYEFTFITNQCGSYSGEGDCYNREHSWPKSWFADGTPMYSDLFHLYPTDGYVNGRRSNYPFGEVGSVSWTSTNGSKLGTSSYPGYTGTVFEPIDEYKGDFARSYFYMATRYENVISSWPGSDMLDGSNDQCFTDWALSMLIEWHNNDPVSQKETERNNAVYAIQHNRNPFIDHPEYVAKIWGGAITNNPPSIAGIILNPVSPKSTDPVNVSVTITDSDGTIISAVLKWSLVSGNLSNTINLTKISGNTYSTVSAIPAQSDGVIVYYQLEATDDSSDVTSTSQYSYMVNDNYFNLAVLNEPFTNCPPSGWLTYSVYSNKNWTCGSGYELINGYGGDVASNDWLISPAIDLDKYHNEELVFKSWTKYTDDGNHPSVKIKYSTNYLGTGNPELADWTELNAVWPSANSQTWTSSGNIDISSIIGDQVFFAFQYTSTGTGASTSAQWEIDSVIIIGDDIVTNNNPVISNLMTTPESPISGQPVTVSATITDNDGSILFAKIKWGIAAGTYSNTVNMNAVGNVFSGQIPAQLAGNTIYYILETADNDNSTSTSEEQEFYVSEIPNVALVISEITLNPPSPFEGEPIVVSATITDSDGTVSSAVINYGTTSGNYTQVVSMTKSGDSFSGTIPSQLAGTTIYFVVEALDNDSEESVSDENSFLVTEPINQAPKIENIEYSPLNPDQNQSVTINADITDADGTISSCKIKWGTTQGLYPNIVNMSSAAEYYSGLIPGQIGSTTIYFRIVAIDNDNDSTVTSEYSYVVNTPGNMNPEISDLFFDPSTPTSSQVVNVSAIITDTDGSIISAKIKWGTISGVFSNQISMILSEGVYVGIIPMQPNNTQVYFVIEAADNLGGVTTSSEQHYTVLNPPNENPEISNISFIPTVPTSSQQVSVTATITDDNDNISSAIIKWGTTTGVYTHNISMSKDIDNYSGLIPAQLNNTQVFFVIEATDTDNGLSTSLEHTYIVVDPINNLPQISNILFLPTNPTSQQEVIVSAEINDSDGSISSATLKWGLTTGVYGNAVNMNFSTDKYIATIPPQANGARVYFIVEAIDDNLGTNNSLESNYLVLDPPNVAPVISDVQFTPVQPTDRDSVLVTASITDSDGIIAGVLLKWKRNAETTVCEKTMNLIENQYQTYIPAQEAGRTVYFIIIATDDDNSQSSYMDGAYSVITSSGIENVDIFNSVRIYPNPTQGTFNIEYREEISGCKIEIYDIVGIKVFEEKFLLPGKSYTINLSGKPKGLHYLTITTSKQQITRKIVLY